jgi:hypothetical protein
MSPSIRRVDTTASHYRFDSLRHGDAIEVTSKSGALEMFRRWKKLKGRRGRLVSSRDYANVLFFIDDDAAV